MTAWEEYGRSLLAAHTAEGPDPSGAAAADADLLAALQEPSRFAALCSSAVLSPAEAQVLALLCAVEVSPELQRLVDALQGTHGGRVQLATLARLQPSPRPGALAVAESGRLRRAALVDVSAAGPWGAREVSVPAAVVWHLCGDDSPDADLPSTAKVLAGSGATADTAVLHLVSGADRQTRRREAGAALGGRGVLVTAPPVERTAWDAVVREATVRGAAVLLEVDGRDEAPVPIGLDAVLRRADHLAWGVSSASELPLSELPDLPRRDVAVPDGAAQVQDWLSAVGELPPEGVRLDRRQVQLVALSDAPVGEAVRRLAGGHLERLATRVRPRRGWDDLVLPPALSAQVRGLVARHRQRRLVYDEWGFPGLPSRGTVGLMAGPSGTGKTLTAEVVAGELGLDLFVLDLSSVLSKYIGETEKNLGALFDAAQTGDVVLFFDEADALFGKRSAVSDAKDRYANVEVAYLLQRLERHDGLVLLATNLPKNIDDAFVRRLHATLEFSLPEPEQRRGIWERAFPPGCPTKDVDLDLLAAEVELAGGPIATAALAAAFSAADAGEPVTMPRVLSAVAAEYRKQGRLSLPPALGAHVLAGR